MKPEFPSLIFVCVILFHIIKVNTWKKLFGRQPNNIKTYILSIYIFSAHLVKILVSKI